MDTLQFPFPEMGDIVKGVPERPDAVVIVLLQFRFTETAVAEESLAVTLIGIDPVKFDPEVGEVIVKIGSIASDCTTFSKYWPPAYTGWTIIVHVPVTSLLTGMLDVTPAYETFAIIEELLPVVQFSPTETGPTYVVFAPNFSV